MLLKVGVELKLDDKTFDSTVLPKTLNLLKQNWFEIDDFPLNFFESFVSVFGLQITVTFGSVLGLQVTVGL